MPFVIFDPSINMIKKYSHTVNLLNNKVTPACADAYNTSWYYIIKETKTMYQTIIGRLICKLAKVLQNYNTKVEKLSLH